MIPSSLIWKENPSVSSGNRRCLWIRPPSSSWIYAGSGSSYNLHAGWEQQSESIAYQHFCSHFVQFIPGYGLYSGFCGNGHECRSVYNAVVWYWVFRLLLLYSYQCVSNWTYYPNPPWKQASHPETVKTCMNVIWLRYKLHQSFTSCKSAHSIKSVDLGDGNLLSWRQSLIWIGMGVNEKLADPSFSTFPFDAWTFKRLGSCCSAAMTFPCVHWWGLHFPFVWKYIRFHDMCFNVQRFNRCKGSQAYMKRNISDIDAFALILSNNSFVKWRPAVGAAIEPLSLEYTVW